MSKFVIRTKEEYWLILGVLLGAVFGLFGGYVSNFIYTQFNSIKDSLIIFNLNIPFSLLYNIGISLIFIVLIIGFYNILKNSRKEMTTKPSKIKPKLIGENKSFEKSNLIWFSASIIIFLIGASMIYEVTLSLNSKTLPLSIPVSIYGTNVTNFFFCDRGINHIDTVVRGDNLNCKIIVQNKPENSISYKVDVWEVSSPSVGGTINVLANYSLSPTNKIDNEKYESYPILLSVPESQSFGLTFQVEGTYMTSPIWITTSSESDLNQRTINTYLILIPSILALLGIFPAMRSLREMLRDKNIPRL